MSRRKTDRGRSAAWMLLVLVTGGGSAFCLVGLAAALVLMLGANYYVDYATGNDANAGSQSMPWKTLGRVITYDNVASGSTIYLKGPTVADCNVAGNLFFDNQYRTNRNWTFIGYESVPGDGGSCIIEIDSNTYFIRNATTQTGHKWTFENCIFKPKNMGSTKALFEPSTENLSLEFINCGVDLSAVGDGNNMLWLSTTTLADPNLATRTLTFTDCNIQWPTNRSSFWLSCYSWKTLTFSNTTIALDPNVSASGVMLQYAGRIGQIVIDGCTFSGRKIIEENAGYGTTVGYLGPPAGELNTFRCRNSTFITTVGAMWLQSRWDSIEISDCNFVCDRTNSYGSDYLVGIGVTDANDTREQWSSNGIFRGNRLTGTGTYRNGLHAFYIGPKSNCWEVAYNRITMAAATGPNTQTLGLAIKGDAANIHHNVVWASSPLALAQASSCKVVHNTIVASDPYSVGPGALRILVNSDQVGPQLPLDNVLTDNIFDGSRTKYAVFLIDPNDLNHRLDRNCYVAGSQGLAYVAAHTADPNCADLAELQTAWGTAGVCALWPLNDAHSVEVDPKFWDPNDGVRDFRVMRNSPLIDNDPNRPRMGTTYGAEQGTGTLTVNSGAGGPGRIPF